MPNIYNPQTQPLSPYLNLLRGGNPGVNYYYGVRPGTVGGARVGVGGAPYMADGRRTGRRSSRSWRPPRTRSLPPEPGRADVLPPAGHPVVFSNTMGYFPGAVRQRRDAAGAVRHRDRPALRSRGGECRRSRVEEPDMDVMRPRDRPRTDASGTRSGCSRRGSAGSRW